MFSCFVVWCSLLLLLFFFFFWLLLLKTTIVWLKKMKLMGIASDLYSIIFQCIFCYGMCPYAGELVRRLFPCHKFQVVSMYGWHAGFLVGLLRIQSGEKRRNDMGGLPKIGVFTPQIIHLFIGFSIIFAIHFGGFPPIFGNIHINITSGNSFQRSVAIVQ